MDTQKIGGLSRPAQKIKHPLATVQKSDGQASSVYCKKVDPSPNLLKNELLSPGEATVNTALQDRLSSIPESSTSNDIDEEGTLFEQVDNQLAAISSEMPTDLDASWSNASKKLEPVSAIQHLFEYESSEVIEKLLQEKEQQVAFLEQALAESREKEEAAHSKINSLSVEIGTLKNNCEEKIKTIEELDAEKNAMALQKGTLAKLYNERQSQFENEEKSLKLLHQQAINELERKIQVEKQSRLDSELILKEKFKEEKVALQKSHQQLIQELEGKIQDVQKEKADRDKALQELLRLSTNAASKHIKELHSLSDRTAGVESGYENKITELEIELACTKKKLMEAEQKIGKKRKVQVAEGQSSRAIQPPELKRKKMPVRKARLKGKKDSI